MHTAGKSDLLPEFLYRALRAIEIEQNYNLIPKSSEPFSSGPRFGIDMVFPISFGGPENAARQHNWNQNGFPTRGISSTPFRERAEFYGQTNKVIVKIATRDFEQLGISTFRIKDLKHGIAVPEDDEYIIIYKQDGVFPKQIIVEVIKLDER